VKIAYLCTWELSSNDGVTKKIVEQVKAWEGINHEVEVFCCCRNLGDSLLKAKCYKQPNFKSLWSYFSGPEKLISDIKKYNPDFIYLRHELYKPYLRRLLKKNQTVVEINADDVLELKLLSKTSIKSFLRYMYHLRTRNLLFNNVKAIVSVTRELAERKVFKRFNKPLIISPNSIMLNDNLKRTKRHGKVYLAFIGSLTQPWQGLDKVIRLADILGENYVFHIIGNSNGEKNLENVIYHGYLQKAEYEKVLKECHIGIGTLAAHRKGLQEACALKVREYIAYGLPVILGYKDTAFIDETPKWVLEVPNAEDSLENTETIEQIKEFIKNMKNYTVMNDESRKYIDAYELEKRKIDEICRLLY